MEEFYKDFHKQVQQRIDKYKKLYSFGEDSIRYDFYHTAITYFHLSPTDLILEQVIPSSQFTPKKRDGAISKQGRHTDKPEFDLRIDASKHLKRGIIVEFAYFRETEKSNNQAKTKNHGKLLHDIFRLALLKHFRNDANESIYKDFSDYLCLLVCVTDDDMINYGHNVRGKKPISIQNDYELSDDFLYKFPDTAKKNIVEMFSQQIENFKIIPTAKRVFEQIELATLDTPKWATWIWEVDFKETNKTD